MSDTAPNAWPDGRVAKFYRALPGATLPVRADRAALGVIPTAAFQYCEALTSASAFGWYIFAPLSFHLQWDGTDVIWTHEGADGWFPLGDEVDAGFAELFDRTAPEDMRGFAPPFLAQTFTPGIVQVWSGLFAQTAPGWSSLIRPPANIARSQGFEAYEGIVETDRWFGPLFVNVRLTATDRPIAFSTKKPLFQLQPLKRETYSEEHLRSFDVVDGLGAMSEADWAQFRATVIRPNQDPKRRVGRYAADVRKRPGHGTPPAGE
jgi:Family of unknown function (DUF6065)